MRGDLAQIIALCTRANAHAQGRSQSFAGNTTAKYCRTIDFAIGTGGRAGKPVTFSSVAPSPDAWFAWLLNNGLSHSYVSRMTRAAYLGARERDEDWKTTAFVGGGNVWVLSTVLQNGQTVAWVPVWRKIEGDQPWDITYKGFGETYPFEKGSVDVSTTQLRKALSEIREFASEYDIRPWPDMFSRALAQLHGVTADSHQPDIFPPDLLDTAAENLGKASAAGWVFGGMGSWNDIYFQDAPRYQPLSEALFEAVSDGILVATNSLAAPQPRPAKSLSVLDRAKRWFQKR